MRAARSLRTARIVTVFWEDLRENLVNYRLLVGLAIFQVLQSFLLDTDPYSAAATESLLQDFFYLVSLIGAGFFSVLGSLALLEEEKLGTIQTLFTAPLSVKEYLVAKISFPTATWLLAWVLVLLNLRVMKPSIGEMPLPDMAIASFALLLCVESMVLFTLLVSTLLRDSRPAILVTFSLIFVYLLLLHPFYLEGVSPDHPIGQVGWLLPLQHADRAWIWIFDRNNYAEIAINPMAELAWLTASCLILWLCLNTLLLVRYRRRIE